MSKTLIFTYGLLMPEHRPPKTMVTSWEDQIPGELYDLGEWPAAIKVGKSEYKIFGHVAEIDEDELMVLDEFEDVDSGLYRRCVVTTEKGFPVWVYEYLRELPEEAPRIERWVKD